MRGLCQPPRQQIWSSLRFSANVYSCTDAAQKQFPALAVQENHLGAFKYRPPPDTLTLLGAAQGWGHLKSSPGDTPAETKTSGARPSAELEAS